MWLQSCPKQESLFEFISIPAELSLWRRTSIRSHAAYCSSCRESIQSLRAQWTGYFTPEPDITSSLMNVYSRLQHDETLILKGWKLSETHAPKRLIDRFGFQSVMARTAFSVGLASLAVFVVLPILRKNKADIPQAAYWTDSKAPLAQVRFEDKNRVKVEYIQPEMLQSIEFETSAR